MGPTDFRPEEREEAARVTAVMRGGGRSALPALVTGVLGSRDCERRFLRVYSRTLAQPSDD
jgi:hypothetical protein